MPGNGLYLKAIILGVTWTPATTASAAVTLMDELISLRAGSQAAWPHLPATTLPPFQPSPDLPSAGPHPRDRLEESGDWRVPRYSLRDVVCEITVTVYTAMGGYNVCTCALALHVGV